MTKSQTFLSFIHPVSNWGLRVVVHPNQRSLLVARKRLSAKADGPVMAFFWHPPRDQQFKDDKKIIGEIHFNRKNLGRNYVVHEATHACVEFAWLCQLDVFCERRGEEMFVEAVDALTVNIFKGFKQYCNLRFPQ